MPIHLLDSAQYHVLILGPEGDILFANHLFKKSFNALFSKFDSPTFKSVLFKEDVEKWQGSLQLLKTSVPVALDLRLMNEDEFGYSLFNWEFSKLEEKEEIQAGIFCIGYQRFEISDKEIDSKEKQCLDAIIQQTADCFFQLDREWKIVEINEPAAKAMGTERDALLMKCFWEVHRNHQEFAYPELLKEAMTQNHPLFFNEYDAGTDTWYQVSVFSSPLGVTVFFRDVTEEKLKNDVASRSSVVLRSVLESMSDCFLLIDRDKKVVGYNQAAQRYLGQFFDQQLQYGDDFLDYVKLMKLPEFTEALDAGFLGDGREYEREVTFMFGVPSWLLFKFSPIKNAHGSIDNIAFTCKNIDQRKRYYLQLEEKNKVLREIAYTQSHVIRSPLSSILGLLGLIDGSNLSKEDRELFAMLKPLAEQLDSVIKDNVNHINQLEE